MDLVMIGFLGLGRRSRPMQLLTSTPLLQGINFNKTYKVESPISRRRCVQRNILDELLEVEIEDRLCSKYNKLRYNQTFIVDTAISCRRCVKRNILDELIEAEIEDRCDFPKLKKFKPNHTFMVKEKCKIL